jgi:hypothetical protein
MTVNTCAVTGLIVGDSDACGDCDPCIFGQQSVPIPVQRLLKAKDEWRERYGSMAALNDALVNALEFYANPEVYKPHPHGPAFDDRDLGHVARAALAEVRGRS